MNKMDVKLGNLQISMESNKKKKKYEKGNVLGFLDTNLE